MRVKDAMLTFVAMGGFAVPVVFQNTASANPAQTIVEDQIVATVPLKDELDTK